MKQHLALQREAIETGKSVRELCLEHGVLGTEEEFDIIFRSIRNDAVLKLLVLLYSRIRRCNVKNTDPFWIGVLFLKDIKYSV